MNMSTSNDDMQRLLQQLSQQLEANSRHIEEIAERQASLPLRHPYWMTEIDHDSNDGESAMPAMHTASSTLKYKLIHPDTFTANKNDDVDSWLFSIKQYAWLVKIPEQEIMQFAATLLWGCTLTWWQHVMHQVNTHIYLEITSWNAFLTDWCPAFCKRKALELEANRFCKCIYRPVYVNYTWFTKPDTRRFDISIYYRIEVLYATRTS